MTMTIEQILKNYNPKTVDETKAALREILQSTVLVGLSKAGFFERASFYGGTALRIFYGLNRYSEDLDFTLNFEDENFSIDDYTYKIKEVASSFGLNLDIVNKVKKVDTPIASAFAKLNSYQTLISLKLDNKMINLLHKDELIKVKFEVDCNPPLGFDVETKWIDTPEFAPIIVLDKPSLFAGKIHAILCRTYKNTVKGRDYYDFLYYISQHVKPNLEYLRNKLIDTGKLKADDEFNIEILKTMLIEKFKKVDFDEVKDDAKRFITDEEDLNYYSKDLFIQMVDRL